MMAVLDWVAQYCDTMEDVSSLQIMRVFAIDRVLEAQTVLDAIPDEKDFAQIQTSHIAAVEQIEARLKVLDAKPDGFGRGMTHEKLAAFERIRKARA